MRLPYFLPAKYHYRFLRLLVYLPAKYYFRFLRWLVCLGTRSCSLKRRPGLFGLLLRGYLPRPEWMCYPPVELEPIKRFTFRPRREPDAADLRLSERLVAA